MKAYGSINFILPVSGETGYNNQSKLSLELSIGKLQLPPDAWDLSSIAPSTIERISLSIPSGNLEVFDISHYAIDIQQDITTWSFLGRGQWDGMQNGMKGGMSGYGGFKMSRVYVCEGVYRSAFGLIHPSIEQYNALKIRAQILRDSKSLKDDEVDVAKNGSYPEWQKWLEYLLTPVAIAKEESIVTKKSIQLGDRYLTQPNSHVEEDISF